VRSSLTKENADLVFIRRDKCVQDVIPCVIEDGRVVGELRSTQHGDIGPASVVETDLGYIQLGVLWGSPRFSRLKWHSLVRLKKKREEREGDSYGTQSSKPRGLDVRGEVVRRKRHESYRQEIGGIAYLTRG